MMIFFVVTFPKSGKKDVKVYLHLHLADAFIQSHLQLENTWSDSS